MTQLLRQTPCPLPKTALTVGHCGERSKLPELLSPTGHGECDKARRIALLAGPNDHLIGPNYQATGRISSDNSAAFFHNADAERMPKKNKDPTFEDLNPRTLFREFAAECMELAQTTPTPEKRLLYLKMARLWHQIAQRWEKKG